MVKAGLCCLNATITIAAGPASMVSNQAHVRPVPQLAQVPVGAVKSPSAADIGRNAIALEYGLLYCSL
jgi:hypothetical protein